MTCVMLCAVAIFALGRVALAVQATEASYEANRIREDIKAERLTGQLLEVDKSALTTPSRIEAIAGSTMRMADADEVCYLALPEEVVECAPATEQAPEASEVAVSEKDGGVVRALMDMAAQEAQVLLVGDVGLASPR
jgi:cell division protein FtsL